MKNRISLLLLVLFCYGCGKDFASPANTPTEVFETLWTYFDEHYSYFEFKNIDWQDLKVSYGSQVQDDMSQDALFELCSDMILELKDGHNAIARTSESIVYDFTEGYDVQFDFDVVKNQYLKGETLTQNNFTYGIIQDSIGYVYYEDFDNGRPFDEIVQYFIDNQVIKIILDIRSNGGGDAGVAQLITEHFLDQPRVIGSMVFKNGKEAEDFTDKININATPRSPSWTNKLNVLINRRSFSATSYLSGMLQYLDHVQLIGQITGGGGGGRTSFELQNGWIISATSNYFLDSQGYHIEAGVAPHIEINNTADDLENGIDRMLEEAIRK